MIVVEGPDGAGKTTLIKQLTTDLELPTAPRACSSKDGPVQNLYEWTTEDINNHINELEACTLHDRYPLLSEPIYGPLTRGKLADGFDSSWFAQAWKAFIDIRPIVIFCLPPIDAVVKNVDKEDTPQMDGVVFNIRAIYWLYYNLLTRVRATQDFQTILWDYTDALSEPNYQEITKYLQTYKERRTAGEYQRY